MTNGRSEGLRGVASRGSPVTNGKCGSTAILFRGRGSDYDLRRDPDFRLRPRGAALALFAG